MNRIPIKSSTSRNGLREFPWRVFSWLLVFTGLFGLYNSFFVPIGGSAENEQHPQGLSAETRRAMGDDTFSQPWSTCAELFPVDVVNEMLSRPYINPLPDNWPAYGSQYGGSTQQLTLQQTGWHANAAWIPAEKGTRSTGCARSIDDVIAILRAAPHAHFLDHRAQVQPLYLIAPADHGGWYNVQRTTISPQPSEVSEYRGRVNLYSEMSNDDLVRVVDRVVDANLRIPSCDAYIRRGRMLPFHFVDDDFLAQLNVPEWPPYARYFMFLDVIYQFEYIQRRYGVCLLAVLRSSDPDTKVRTCHIRRRGDWGAPHHASPELNQPGLIQGDWTVDDNGVMSVRFIPGAPDNSAPDIVRP